jgi:hypothetical protein
MTIVRNPKDELKTGTLQALCEQLDIKKDGYEAVDLRRDVDAGQRRRIRGAIRRLARIDYPR